MTDMTYQIATCSAGCAFHTTLAEITACGACGAPMAPPVTVDRAGALDILRHESDGRYAAGKAATLEWLARQGMPSEPDFCPGCGQDVDHDEDECPGLLAAGVAAGYAERLDAVLARIDAYHPDCERRWATDEYHDAARCLRQSAGWLAGDNDRSWAGQLGTLAAFRVHYARDALREALHHLVWAERYAGLRDEESASSMTQPPPTPPCAASPTP